MIRSHPLTASVSEPIPSAEGHRDHMYLYFDGVLQAWVLATKTTGIVAAANGSCEHPGEEA